MDAYCLFGYPVSHSWSPFIHGLFARQTGQEMVYRLAECPPDRFRHDVLDFFFEKAGCGCNVTLPHKRAAAEIVNSLTTRAGRADAVNTIVRREGQLLGDNTDGAGLVTDLKQNLELVLRSARILMIGAGGAARGCIGPLLQLAPSRLVIANRTIDRAIALAREFADLGPVAGTSFDGRELSTPFDLVINATSAGIDGEVARVNPKVIGPATTCYDMFYGAGETPFTRWARQRRPRQVVQGWGMLVEQAAEAFRLWRGVQPATKPVLEALQSGAAAAATETPQVRYDGR